MGSDAETPRPAVAIELGWLDDADRSVRGDVRDKLEELVREMELRLR